MKFVTYIRVSTQRQGQSGLGLEAQRSSVSAYVLRMGGTVISEFVEIESGRKNDRPELALALADAKRNDATLLIAKLDRLARNVAFIANLLESNVEVSAADMPEASRFILHVLAAVAEHEAKSISERTKAALAVAKARGVKMGWSNPSRRDEHRQSSQKGAETLKAKADEFAANVRPIVRELRSTGLSLRGVAAILNERGIKTARGGKWAACTVRNVLARESHGQGIAVAL